MARPTIRGIRLRLALALLLVVAGALGVVYLIVVPSLEAELVDAKLDQLEEDAKTVAPGLATNAEQAAAVRGVRVLGRPGARRHLHRRSRAGSSVQARLEHVLVARRGARSGRDARRRRPAGCSATRSSATGAAFAEVALVEDETGPVILLSDSLSDPLSSVDFVQRQLLLAGLIGLALRRRASATCSPRCTHAGSPGSSAPRSGSRPGGSTSPSSTPATTSSGSWRSRSSACASGCRTSTARGASSSPTRRTSCGRRSSRSAASSS